MQENLTYYRALIAAIVVAFMLTFGILPKANAQGLPYGFPFTGVQPATGIDFNTPPISYAPQGLTAASNQGLAASIPGIGNVAYASLGNATTYIAGQVFVASIYVPFDMTVTNINVLNGATVGTNTVIYALYNTAGTRIATTSLAGVTTAGANAFQAIPLTAPLAIQGPGRYFVSVQANGTTDNVRTVAASTFVGVLTQSNAGAFGTLPALVVPTTFTANVGPIAFLN